MASTVVELLFHPITRSVTRVFYYSRNVKSLETHMEELSDKKTRVLHSVEEATNKTEEIEDDVVEWLASVDAITEEADRVLKDKDKAKKRCFMGLFPNLMTRYRVSIEIKSIDEEAGNISLNGDKFDRVSYLPARRGIGDRSVKDYEAFESRRHVLNEILEALKDNDVNLVGVYGMPGVGKTTIVKKVAEQVKANRIFDVVVLAVVSKTPDLRRIQGEIADGLGFELKAETDRGRAERLRERLERETKVLERETKVLVILDDIWERLELDDVGIPSGSDNRGCKILMTSRDRNALYRGMDTKKLFHLQVLLENEAWNLFENKAGDPIKKPDLQLVAVEVAKRCAGLPILLVTVASALKDGDLSEWKDALERLKRFDKDEIDSRVYSALELSYTSLKGEEIKSVFLLCGQLIPHIIRIHDLLKYTVGLGLFKGISTLEEARHRLNKLVNDLIACCLLEGGADGIVKMHDVLHAFAASVASRDHHVFTSSSGTVLREWPAKNMLEQYSAISLPACKIPGLPEVLNCPKLESFILYNEDPSLKIPDCLFKGTKTLQLMDMTDVQLPTLPSSFQFLEKLQTLCLNSCGLEDIALIGELKMLKVLSLIGSNIVRLPREIGKLTRLQLLDLRDNPTLEIIPPNVLSCLTQLEDLYMENSFLQWGVEGLDSLRNNASLAELKNLPYLSTLYLHITDPMILPKDFFSKKLERFNILIGEGWEWSSKRETSTIMKLKISASIQSEEGIQLLLKRTEDLHLDGLEGVKSVSYELDGQGFPSLKHLHIQNSLEIRYIVDSTMLSPIVAFPFLVSLSLDNLNKLEKICNGQPVAESFSKLRILKVKRCPMLKNLFSLHMERGLLQLEEIVAEESGGEADEDEAIKLTQLRTLTLKYLPQFTSVSSKSNAASISQTRPEPTNLENCPVFVRLTSLIVEGCRNLKYLFTTSMVESLAQLKRLELCDCVSMEEIIIKNGLGEEENVRGVMLPKLQFLKLKGLPNLTRFCTACICVFGFQAIPNLEELSLDVKDAAKVCQGQFSADLFHKVRVLALRCFDDASAEFPFGILHGFQNMEKLVVNGGCYKELFPCQLVDEEEHTLDRIRCLELGYLSDLEKIWNQDLRVDQLLQNLETLEVRFCDSLINLAPSASSFGNLTALHVRGCKALKYLVTSSTARSLVQLSVMSIKECEMVTEIVASNGDEAGNEIIFRKLESLKLDCLASLTSFCSVNFTFRFPCLTEVIVTNCPKMKTFSLGILSTPKLQKKKRTKDIGKATLTSPFNSCIYKLHGLARNVKSLETQMEELSDIKTRVLHSVEEAKNKTEVIEDDVVKWLDGVAIIIEEADRVLKDKDKAKKRCFMGLFPNLMTRYRVSTEIKNIEEEAVKISLRGKFDRVSYLPARRGIGDRSVKGYKAFESRRHVLDEILEALKDNDVNLVGVYGMPGVGKTTIVKKVAEQVKANRIFDVVVLAVVSKTPDLRRIQGEIADGLGFELKAETISGRAEHLRERLERQTKVHERETKVLVILDDIWERLELDDVGIPSGSDNRGCKILMTSRDRNALYRGMDTKKLFHLQVLLENEAWNLFENKAGDPIKKPDLQLVAVEVAKRCAGLPILLVTVASALKDGDLSEWKDALERLKRFDKEDIDSRVYSALELSYTSLKGEEIKSVFLLCGQLRPHGIPFLDLLKYTVGLGLFKRISTLEQARNRLHKLVNDLIASCLLEGVADVIVKMHDVLHGFAASVASRDHHVFTSSSGTVLREWPAKDMLEQYSAISLPGCKISGLPEVLNCPKMESFILYNGDPSLKIPECLFKGTKTLQLMDMTEVQLPTLPSSLQFLEKLQTLCLDHCGLGDIALIGELKMLKVLSLMGSNIVQLPREIGQLTRLQLLDLTDNPTLEIIPPNVLSCLTQLEDLYMENSFLQWGVEGLDDRRNNASLAELKDLPCLSTLYLHITDPMILPKDFFSKKLERFNILIGEGWEWSRKRETSTIMKLKISASIHSEEGIQLLLKRTEDLYLDGLEGVKSVSYELDGQGFPSLKHLHIQNSLEIRYIVDSTMLSPIVAFPFLVSLSLDNLNKLEKICNGQPVAESFSKLRILKVKSCPMLKNFFSLHMERGLLQLEEIVAEESGGEVDEDEAIKLTQLRTLTLEYLPQFTSVSSKSNAASISQTRPEPLAQLKRLELCDCVSMEEIIIKKGLGEEENVIPNLEELSLDVKDAVKVCQGQFSADLFHKVRVLELQSFDDASAEFPFSILNIFHNLEKLVVTSGNFKELFPCQLVDEEEHTLARIRCLGLVDLPDLEKIWNQDLRVDQLLQNLETLEVRICDSLINLAPSASSFGNLTALEVEDCKALKYLVTSSTARSLVQLSVMSIRECKMVTEIVASNGDEAGNEIIFRKLESLKLDCLASLTSFCSVDFTFRFPRLTEVIVTNCPKMKTFSLGILSTPKLRKDQPGELSYGFVRLTSLIVEGCRNLKYLFTTSMVESLAQLKRLELCDCVSMEEIIIKNGLGEEANARGTMLPKLEALKLKGLPNLTRFCTELSLDVKDAAKVCQGQFSADLFHKVRVLALQSLDDAATEFPFGILHRFQNMEKLVVTSGYLKELVPCQLVDEEEHTLARIRCLELAELPYLEKIWNQDLRVDQLLQNLETLEVRYCDSLINLAPSASTFGNLTALHVRGCKALKYLVTSSTARSLVQLSVMSIRECEMVTEIVASNGDEAGNEIIFWKLESLKLGSLASLTSFCSVNFTFRFPCLTEVIVTNCPKMKTFSLGILSTPKLQKKKRTKYNGKATLTSPFNSCIYKLGGLASIIPVRWYDGNGLMEYFICSKVKSRTKNQKEYWARQNCIGSAFNVKGAMQCPNCRKIEKGQWLYANGCRSLPEFSMEDWAHDEDLYDLSYSEMSFGVHWCPFGSLTRLPSSFEEGEFSSNGCKRFSILFE
uniref:AAA+ ATPase domain-containing protein n=1 Tax=Salix viminalis TaxID=40686 RepID=A0A6N2MH75_SALVM